MDFPVFETFFLNTAHRGARSLAPENTLAAARKALESGAHLWELDVRSTADGELVVVHDATMERTSDVRTVFPFRKPWAVRDFTMEEIGRLDFGSWFVREDPFKTVAGGEVSKEEAGSYAGERAPTLRQALEFTVAHDWAVNVEIKDLSGLPGHETVVEKVVRLIDEFESGDRVIVSSFNHGYLAKVRTLSRKIATGVLVSRSCRDPVGLLRNLGAQACHFHRDAVGEKEIAALRRAGLETFVWVVNEEEEMRRFFRWGARGVFTDFPQRFPENDFRLP